MEQCIVLIPSYKPDASLLLVAEGVISAGLTAIIVDDGGGAAFADIFTRVESLGATVLRHAVNLGKGRALKTGINHIMLHFSGVKYVVTADSDGQHALPDILAVRDKLIESGADLVIGARAFTGEVPLRSRFGNSVTRGVFKCVTRLPINDTQTGLRGLNARILPGLMRLFGERYEFEMNMLLYARAWRMTVMQIPIETIYIDNNAGSHYNPLKDSIKVFGQIGKYICLPKTKAYK